MRGARRLIIIGSISIFAGFLVALLTNHDAFALKVLAARIRGYDGCTCGDCADAFGFGPKPGCVVRSLDPKGHVLMLLVGSGACLISTGLLLRATTRGRGHPACDFCGYDLRGLHHTICPECGSRGDDVLRRSVE